MKKELILFCSSNYTNIKEELIQNRYKLFDIVNLLNENDLDDNIKSIIDNIIKQYGERGYGYWVWKPYIILQELNKLNEGDILVHLDIHCIDDNLKDKFNEIINLLNDQPIILGIGGQNDYIYTSTKLRNHIENYLHYKFTPNQLLEYQYEGGLVFIKNCDKSKHFFKQWFDIMIDDFKYVTDSFNDDKDNHFTFISNRHDQSVASLLYKYNNYKTPIYLDWEFMNIKKNIK